MIQYDHKNCMKTLVLLLRGHRTIKDIFTHGLSLGKVNYNSSPKYQGGWTVLPYSMTSKNIIVNKLSSISFFTPASLIVKHS